MFRRRPVGDRDDGRRQKSAKATHALGHDPFARKSSRLIVSDRLYETAAGSPDRQSTG
jgi:hypothetical protein